MGAFKDFFFECQPERRYAGAMDEKPDSPKPDSPWRLNPARILILILGALVLVYVVSSVMGGLGNYELLKQAATEAKPPS
ncbi:hypothetical protein [Devosia sp.]|uniref:hypothetical protein n=1 Tax=Devosia sp. TaxID=1871048 RepID=UPI003BAC4A13